MSPHVNHEHTPDFELDLLPTFTSSAPFKTKTRDPSLPHASSSFPLPAWRQADHDVAGERTSGASVRVCCKLSNFKKPARVLIVGPSVMQPCAAGCRLGVRP